MVIAPVLDDGATDWSVGRFGVSWRCSVPELVRDRAVADAEARPHARSGMGSTGPVVPWPDVSVAVRTRVDVSRREVRGSAVRRRRRGVLLGVIGAGVTCALALPIAPLGGAPAEVHPQGDGQIASERIYVVRPGDTLWSIASHLDGGGDPRPLAEALAREIGSAVVVPGERIPIP